MFRKEYFPLIGGLISILCLGLGIGLASLNLSEEMIQIPLIILLILSMIASVVGFLAGVILLFKKVTKVPVFLGMFLSGSIIGLYIYSIYDFFYGHWLDIGL